MSVEINKIDERTFTVNDKMVKQNMDGYWVEMEELTPNEEKAFKAHLNSVKLDSNRQN